MMSSKRYFDLAVIGSGPGGYVAAIEAARHGAKVALIEKGKVGGVCLHLGCIPTKSLIAHAHLLRDLRRAAEFGISTGPISFDYGAMKQRKDGVVDKIAGSLERLIQSHGVTILRGMARFIAPQELKIVGPDATFLSAEKFIVATGSEPLEVAEIPCDHQRICNSSSALQWETLPQSLAIVGAGYIGSEFASLFAELGVKVYLIEALPTLMANHGKALSDFLFSSFKRRGIETKLSVSVTSVEKRENSLLLHLRGADSLEVERVLVAVGRKIVSHDLGLELAGVIVDAKGAIPVDDKMESNVPGIYAIGDLTGKAMLAHVASHQGVVAAKNAVGKSARIDYRAVPSVIFTMPEVATVGITLEQALEKGLPAVAGSFPFQALGKAVASFETEGFAQLVLDSKSGAILGAQLVGRDASSLIAEIALAIQGELRGDDLIETIHAHPTLPEVWPEAARVAMGIPLHLPARKEQKR